MSDDPIDLSKYVTACLVKLGSEPITITGIYEDNHAEMHALLERTLMQRPGRTTLFHEGKPLDLEAMILPRDFPKIVCLCGSTRFKDAFEQANKRLTHAGHIVLSVGSFPHVESSVNGDSNKEAVFGREVAAALDELHKRKIDLCDEVLVLNVGGYVGDSTRSEIVYAMQHGKVVNYLEGIIR